MNRIQLALGSLLMCFGFNGVTPVQAAVPAPVPLMETQRGEQPIELRALHVSARLRGSLAETTVRMEFYNPNPRQLEGNLQFPLLDGQQVVGFALDFDGKMRPAVPVAKQRGRQVFEAIERRGVDPALLEKTQGNNFRLRVYPIPPKGVRIVEVSYAEALARQERWRRYRLPLAYGGTVAEFSLDVDTDAPGRPRASGVLGGLPFQSRGGLYRAQVTRSQFAPTGEITLLLPMPARAQASVEARGDGSWFVAELPVPAASSKPRRRPARIGLLWDSSMSGATRTHAGELALLDAYFRALRDVQVRLVRLRDRAEPAQDFSVRGGNWSALRRALGATTYDGASALADWTPEPSINEYLLFSDGLLNYGPLGFRALAPGQRLSAIVSSASADRDRLRALAEASGGTLLDLRPGRGAEELRALLGERPRVASLSGEGLADLLAAPGEGRDGFVRVAGRLLSPRATLSVAFDNGDTTRIVIGADAPASTLAAREWASYRLAALGGQPELHRAEIARLGTRFGIATGETSLIVLDRVEDYVEYDIAPPPELANAYAQLREQRVAEKEKDHRSHVDEIAKAFAEKITWWERAFPKGAKPVPPKPKPVGNLASVSVQGGAIAEGAVRPVALLAPGTVSSPNAPPPPPEPRPYRDGGDEDDFEVSAIRIAITPWQADAPYSARMRAAPPADLYAIYLDERASYASSIGFYLDVADLLLERGQRELGLRVLSNLAEMDLDNHHVLRVLGYRLLQAGEPGLAVPVFEKVLRIAEYEPQSFRDLGNALAAAGREQDGVDALTEVVLRPWDERFSEIELIALAELNAIAAGAKTAVDLRRLDPRLRRNLPLDLRAVLTWDADDSDMDLWVTDPNGEKCYYGFQLTYQGGRMSDDFTGGYGPEEFSLRVAKKGRYRIEVHYYGDRQQRVAGPTTLQVRLTTRFGTPVAKDQLISLRLKEGGDDVLVGEFEVE